MSGKPYFLSIYNAHKYYGPMSLRNALEYVEAVDLKDIARTDNDERKKWRKADDALHAFYEDPEGWWLMRANNGPDSTIHGKKDDNDHHIEIPISDLEDQKMCQNIWLWLHGDNLEEDVHITHYKADREVTYEKEKKRSVVNSLLGNKTVETETVTVTEKVLIVSFLFKNKDDAVNFRLACL